MSTETHIHDGTAWRRIRKLHILVSGTTWRDCKHAFMHDGTTWQMVFSRDQYQLANSIMIGRAVCDSNFVYVIRSSGGSENVNKYTHKSFASISAITTHNNAFSISVLSGTLYCAANDAGTHGVYSWDGSTWSLVGSAWTSMSSASEEAIQNDGADLYCYGNYSGGSGIYVFSGGAWTNTGATTPSDAFAVLAGTIYQIRNSGGQYKLHAWSGGAWTVCGSQVFSTTGSGHKHIRVIGSSVYVSCYDATYKGLYSWDGSAWTTHNTAAVLDCCSVGGTLCAAYPGGSSTTGGGLYCYVGGTWVQYNAGMGGPIAECFGAVYGTIYEMWCHHGTIP